jgi:hypothetical protein
LFLFSSLPISGPFRFQAHFAEVRPCSLTFPRRPLRLPPLAAAQSASGPARPSARTPAAEADGWAPPVIAFPTPLPASQLSRGRVRLGIRAAPPHARGPARQGVRAAYLKATCTEPRRLSPRTLVVELLHRRANPSQTPSSTRAAVSHPKISNFRM